MHHWHQDQKRAQIGYWIAKGYEGRGLMSRSAERFVDFMFRKLGLNKVEIHSLPHNVRSLGLADRLGARLEGRIRQSYMSHGSLEDIMILGILRPEWEAIHGPAQKGSS
jgi:ribosomal-protein-serine acetyltransferase